MQKIPTIEEFLKKLESDETLATQYKDLVERKDEVSLREFMKENGVTDEDLEKAKTEIDENGELNDELLENVVGGVSHGLLGDAWIWFHKNILGNQVTLPQRDITA